MLQRTWTFQTPWFNSLTINTKEMNKLIMISFTGLVISGCGRSIQEQRSNIDHTGLPNRNTQLELPQYAAWVQNEENDLVKNKTINDVNYQVAFLPVEFMAYTELKHQEYTEQQFKETKA